jgi:hypothetical protein
MGDNTQDRMTFLQELLADLKKIEGEQQTTIEHIAKIQGAMQNEDEETIASKIGEVFSNANKNTELLHQMIHQYEIEYNRLKSQS